MKQTALNQCVKSINLRRPDYLKPITLEHWGGVGWAVDYGERTIGGRFKTRRETLAFLNGYREAMEIIWQHEAKP